MLRIAPKWASEIKAMIAEGSLIDVTNSHNFVIQFLVVELTKAGRPFKLYSLGAGVKRITTDTDTCPCCKRRLVEPKTSAPVLIRE